MGAFWATIQAFLTPLRILVLVVLGLGLPIFIYLAFIAREPVFEPEQDVELGRQGEEAIAADPENYPLLSRDEYPEAYAHLQRIADNIVGASAIKYRDIFAYDNVKIIHDDEVLNAFCTPGGFIYVYTGLIRYLDAEDHLAGVMGHEIAHAERRHSSLRLQKEFGVKRLLAFAVLTNPVSLTDIANVTILEKITNLSYSRTQEAQSDDDSVVYLSESDYACDGAAGFFEKLIGEGQDVAIPAFLSDHPDSAARVRDIRAKAAELGCSTQLGDPSSWAAFQASLPPAEPAAPAENEEATEN